MLRVQELVHGADIRRIRAGLEMGGMEVLFVILITDRESLQRFAPRRKVGIRDCRNQAGIQPAGKEGCHRYIRYQLPRDGIHHQVPHFGCGVGKIIGVFVVGQLPVAAHGEAQRTNLWHSVFCAAAGLQFLHIAEHPAPRRTAGAEQQHIGQPMGIHLRRDLRVAEQRFQLGSKDQAVPAQGIEQRLAPDAVPRQKELLRPLLPHSKCKNTVQLFQTVRPPLGKSM